MSRDYRFLICAAFLTVCVLLGGGGSPNPLAELIVELCALAMLGLWVVLLNRQRPSPHNPISARLWLCVGVFAAIPIVQLIPLPPALWHSLPGRGTEVAALQLIGSADSWRPISVAPYATLASALSLIPPIVMIFFVSRLPLGQRANLFKLLVGLGIAAALLGLVQVASGNGAQLSLYSGNAGNFATGFQANRNADADVLLIAFLAFLVLLANRNRAASVLENMIAIGVGAFLLLSILVTGSRAGTLLILVGLACALLMLPWRIRRSRRAIAALATAVLIGVVALGLGQNARLQETWVRFSANGGQRSDLWKDTAYAIGQYWPVGSGVGTFATVFDAAERLEVVDRTFPNRAHDEYLEFALEAGLAGLVIVAALAAAAIARIVAILRCSPSRRQRSQAVFAIFACGILGLHSLVDYPMRSLAVACLGAFAIGLLAPIADRRGEIRVVQS